MGLSPDELQGLEMGVGAMFGSSPAAFIMPYLLGAVVDWILLGFITSQFFVWLSGEGKDRKFVVACVVLAMIMSVAASAYVLAWMFDIFVFNFGTYRTFVRNDWVSTYGVLDTVTILIAQTFYLDRAFRLNNRSIWVILVTVPFMLMSAAGAAATRGIYAEDEYGNSEFNAARSKITSYLWVIGILIADLAITVYMSWGLYRAKSDFTHTNKILTRLLLLSLEVQIPALISAVLVAATWFTHETSGTTVGIFFEISHPKVYVLGLLAVLNARYSLRKEMFSTHRNGTSGSVSLQRLTGHAAVTTAAHGDADPQGYGHGRGHGHVRVYTGQQAQLGQTHAPETQVGSYHYDHRKDSHDNGFSAA